VGFALSLAFQYPIFPAILNVPGRSGKYQEAEIVAWISGLDRLTIFRFILFCSPLYYSFFGGVGVFMSDVLGGAYKVMKFMTSFFSA
jgi:hypothetical protein